MNFGAEEWRNYMNEGLTVFLNIDKEKLDENNALIRRIDELLLSSGMKYAGFANMYKPIDPKDRDRAVFDACRALDNADWLKDKLVSTPIMNRTSVCSMEQILLDHMAEPSAEKLEYYENYYRQFHALTHGIVVDESRQLRDGYTSYLIASKYGIHADIYEAFAHQPLKKIVRGRHVSRNGDTWKVKCDKIYAWNYTLKAPVVPGDILKVKTAKGEAYACVCQIDYAAGKGFCEEHRGVIKHMNCRISSMESY